MRYFEDFEIGKRMKLVGSYTFTEQEIIDYASKWDPQPFHIDPAAAAESIFGGIVACSSHIIAASISIAVKDETHGAAAVSALGFEEIRILAPVRGGDTISSEEDILEARLSNSRPDCGIITFLNDTYNQRGERVLTMKNSALIRCRAAVAGR